jgi:hypothetical protein
MSGGYEPLDEEEIAFVWKCITDHGQLTPATLKDVMKEICGMEISQIACKDLLSYMDANGDGVVGQDDFRDFMRIGRLADTNPKEFLWREKQGKKEVRLQTGKPQAENTQQMKRIDAAITRYETDVWQKLVEEEETCMRKTFEKYAKTDPPTVSADGSTTAGSMTAQEYHTVMQSAHKVCGFAIGELQPETTLAVLEDLNRRAGTTGDRNKVTYDVWSALMNGQLKREPREDTK